MLVACRMAGPSALHGQPRQPAIRSAGAKLFFLPKYSPDLNPIEQVFAKLKHLLRKAAARTLEAVVAAIRELLDAYTAPECANYLATAGYGQAYSHPALVHASGRWIDLRPLARRRRAIEGCADCQRRHPLATNPGILGIGVKAYLAVLLA
jgi:hypothetical protein